MHRRHFLGTLAASGVLPRTALSQQAPDVLTAATHRQQILPAGYPETTLWSFDAAFPGRPLRARQGDRLALDVVNDLPQPTAVHWHGLRLDNAMDGVPYLTQAPIQPGETFTYEFDLPDAGTYWYHSHAQSMEQVERGLYGPLIIDEINPPDVDQDLTLVLDDIRLNQDGTIGEFGNFHDLSHAGRIGNLWLANGQIDPAYPIKRGERIRLRLISAANSRIFTLGLAGLEGWIVALDGMPLADPQELPDQITLAPAQRMDLIVDVTTDDDEAFLITFERDGGYAIAHFPVSGAPSPKRAKPDALPANPDFPIDLQNARAATLLIEGGAMGGMRAASVDGEQLGARDLAQRGLFWALNGTAGRPEDPLLDLKLGESVRIGMANDTAFPHAMHLHGVHFAEVLPDGSLGPLRDTILLNPQETREIAFQAHNPGDWLFHCHMLAHHQAGMGTWIRVSA
ncbi:Multicopper oxidase with three cupredoxin domains (includes cell division protein FtsP and spore coat protein CotA) [Marivita hallyeonensis]|uniref:Multicopper oxidase with three cupredoxin domains (Includes cell division protein FtsP and spore coat protein CotA) n=1 Tax=Marivita hallyeonensis TaxID=996342 RepID=A0A1M5N6Q1_9RHOB|nr:Multicopper oxidase with three cupredoxin domains (includes cell division protein FtsP and spore coat protein CotA) [Marivita hallyeonensis]